MRQLIPIPAGGRRQPTRRSRTCARRAAVLKEFVRQQLQLAEDCVVSVSELRCADPDCPDLETVIAVFRPGTATRRLRVVKPLADVSVDDVKPLL